MGDTKIEFKYFSIPEWKKEEQYLSTQHKSGWEFVKVSGIGLYHFKKCEPKDIVYQLDYNSDSTIQKSEYIQMFNDCGWEYLQNYVGYSYFRKPTSEMNGTEEEIFCDNASRLDMMKRIFVGRMLPLLSIFFLIIIPQIVVKNLFPTYMNDSFLVIFYAMFVFYLILFIIFGIQFWKYYQSIHE